MFPVCLRFVFLPGTGRSDTDYITLENNEETWSIDYFRFENNTEIRFIGLY